MVTRFAAGEPMKKTTSEKIRDFFISKVVSHDRPRCVLTDGGKNLHGKPFDDYLSSISCIHKSTTPYHPNTNGLVEQLVSAIKLRLSYYHEVGKTNNWSKHFDDVLFNYNHYYQSAIGCAPFTALTGKPTKSRLIIDNEQITMEIEKIFDQEIAKNNFTIRNNAKPIETRKVTEQRTRETALASMQKEDQKRKLTKFKEGDEVYVRNGARAENFQKTLDYPCEGPFKIIKVLDNNTYKINWPLNSGKNESIKGERLCLKHERPEHLKRSH